MILPSFSRLQYPYEIISSIWPKQIGKGAGLDLCTSMRFSIDFVIKIKIIIIIELCYTETD